MMIEWQVMRAAEVAIDISDSGAVRRCRNWNRILEIQVTSASPSKNPQKYIGNVKEMRRVCVAAVVIVNAD